NLPKVRAHFPALDKDWTYMDNAGGSQTLKPIVDRITEYLYTSDVQHGGSYEVSQLSMERVDAGTAFMAEYINARHPSEIVMGSSTSLVFRILSISLGNTFNIGDEIIVSGCDHEANVSPWMDLMGRGIQVKVWQVNTETWQFELDDLAKLMTNKTRLVAVTHTSNILGTLNPIKEITKFVHDRGAMICVDGVAHAPHRLIDVQDTDVDFYAFSYYKVYGPHYAMLYGKQEHLFKIPGINHYFIDGENSPYKFQPGNVNFEFAYGMLGLGDYLEDMYRVHFSEGSLSRRQQMQAVFDLIAVHEEQLSHRFLDFLKSKPSIRIIGLDKGEKEKRVPTFAFVDGKRNSEEISLATDPHKIAIRFGDFYAKKLIQDLDLDEQNGVVRVSFVHYNTLEEVNSLIEVLDGII
ncbi:MAG: cysteine desulfurase-like protein, partial [Bacteroidota bacterium]